MHLWSIVGRAYAKDSHRGWSIADKSLLILAPTATEAEEIATQRIGHDGYRWVEEPQMVEVYPVLPAVGTSRLTP